MLWLAGRTSPELVERLYSRGLYPWLVATFSFVSRLSPHSLTELLLISLLVWLATRAVRGWRGGEGGPGFLLALL